MKTVYEFWALFHLIIAYTDCTNQREITSRVIIWLACSVVFALLFIGRSIRDGNEK